MYKQKNLDGHIIIIKFYYIFFIEKKYVIK